jgi:Rod binding domain-containing protein
MKKICFIFILLNILPFNIYAMNSQYKYHNEYKINKKTANKPKNQKVHKLAKELQDVLASKLLDSMYDGLDNNSVIGVSNAEKMFRSMLNDERAKYIDLKLVDSIEQKILSKNKTN